MKYLSGKCLIGLILGLTAAQATATEWRLLEADSVSMDLHRTWHLLNPALKPQGGEYYTHGVQMNMDTTLIQYREFRFYWNHKVRGDSTQRQFRHVSWEHESGMSLGKVSVGWHHESRHVMDQEMESTPYPLDDRFFFRMHFLGK